MCGGDGGRVVWGWWLRSEGGVVGVGGGGDGLGRVIQRWVRRL